MADRLTQLQICLDQLVEQFCATLHYVDTHHTFAPLPDEEPARDLDPGAVQPPPAEEFKATINELSTDLILKSRQIIALIDSLPGAGVSQAEQVKKIVELQEELRHVQAQKVEAVRKKEDLLEWVNELVVEFSSDLIEAKKAKQ
ncbi:CYFA0S06e05072g1_1 [Cyberlindnera fabianii]|uniref:Mediator of RNA polymerase II transcription subunit 21 n=1 Tax=Cyberlindnera fabianii TaxID=36022 RepID=A0A061AUE3_CYBFA|nr:Mediator of RNA polymerase II transcription subunit 21 [Cyberlindnera fabianii]CDR41261.1 CYFA0S06e05072g1_1 [Cyberlindnera fabianii]